jgi:hypothetical protein
LWPLSGFKMSRFMPAPLQKHLEGLFRVPPYFPRDNMDQCVVRTFPEHLITRYGRSLLLHLSVLLLVLSPITFPSCSTKGGEHVVTLAKLHNLKTAMPLLTQLVLDGNRPFPKTAEELIDFMEKEGGYERSKDPKDSPLTDGWGNEMRFEGDRMSYTIRSAGPDKLFDTDDDIYLAGNPDGEHIIDGSREKLSGKELLKSPIRVPFQEPNGYYRVSLPGRYAIIKKYSGWQSEITFSYTRHNRVTIVAEPMTRKWDPGVEMSKRLEILRSGRDEAFSGYEVVQYNPVSINKASGYEIMLKSTDILAHTYGIVGRDGIGLSISIITSGEDRHYILDTLTHAIHKSLEIR